MLPGVGLEPSMAPYCPRDKAPSVPAGSSLPLPHLEPKVLEPASAPVPPGGSTYEVPSAPGHCQPQLRYHLLQEGLPEALDRAPQGSTCSNSGSVITISSLGQGLTQVGPAPRGHWQRLGTSVVVTLGVLLALRGWGQGRCSISHSFQEGPHRE